MARAIIFDMFETLITHYNSPLYFGWQMAEDAGVDTEIFLARWRGLEEDRTIGKLSLEQTLEMILKESGVYTEDLVAKIAARRVATCKSCFQNLHPEILPMLEELKKNGMRIGLISNCFSEEAKVIRGSVLFPYFDTVCLSYELGMRKPEEDIYRVCMQKLSAKPEECIYVGDGGSHELETAKRLGMDAVQAVWYLKEGTFQPTGRMREFVQIESPIKVPEYVEKGEHKTYRNGEEANEMQIRRAKISDINGINHLLRQVLMVHHNGRPDLFKPNAKKYTDEELEKIIGNNDTPIFVATQQASEQNGETGENVLGYAFCVFQQHVNNNILTDVKTLYIDDLCVDEEKRGLHIGKQLYEYVLSFAREQECYNVTLNVWSCNEAAMKFYESCGLTAQKVGMEKIL